MATYSRSSSSVIVVWIIAPGIFRYSKTASVKKIHKIRNRFAQPLFPKALIQTIKMKITKMNLLKRLTILGLSSTASSHAAFTLINDFDTNKGTFQVNSSTAANITLETTTVAFGSGVSYANLSDTATGGYGYEAATNAAMNALGLSGTIAFEYLRPNTDWQLSLGSDAFSANRAFSLGINDASLALATDTAYQIFFLYNISGAALTYDDPTIAGLADGSLGNNTAVVFAQQRGFSTFTKSATIARNGSVALEGVWFTRVNTSGTTATRIDNLQQSTMLEVIPEPSTALLGAIGFLALLRRRR